MVQGRRLWIWLAVALASALAYGLAVESLLGGPSRDGRLEALLGLAVVGPVLVLRWPPVGWFLIALGFIPGAILSLYLMLGLLFGLSLGLLKVGGAMLALLWASGRLSGALR